MVDVFFFFWSGIFSTCTKMCDLLQRLMKYGWPNVFVPQQLYNTFPAVMSLLPGKHQTAFANLSKLKLFFQEEIRKHKEDRNPSSPRDYIDCYLDEIEKVTGFSRSWHSDFRKSSLLIWSVCTLIIHAFQVNSKNTFVHKTHPIFLLSIYLFLEAL